MQAPSKGPRAIVVGMIVTVVGIGLLAYWDESAGVEPPRSTTSRTSR